MAATPARRSRCGRGRRPRPQSERLVKAYNDSHKNQVELTVIPTDNYQARVAAAAGGKNLPDVFASDVIYAPNYTSQGLYLDITDRIDSLDFADALAPAHMRLGTYEDAKYTVPHTLDLSVLFWNKDLYKKAGLDPETPPTTMKEFAEHAKTIREKVGGKTYGTFFGGNCPGCFVFTFWPSVWAAGGDIMNEDGTESTIDDPNMAATFEIYNDLVKDDVVAPGDKTEAGPTWTGVFPKGNIGVMPMPSTTLGLMPEGMDIGVAPIPGPDGGESTFVGGDVVGIGATTEQRGRGVGLRRLDAVRGGAGRDPGQEQGRRRPHRPGRQQVLGRGPARGDHQRAGGQGRDAVLAELRRHLQRPDRAVAEGRARRRLRRRRRRARSSSGKESITASLAQQ